VDWKLELVVVPVSDVDRAKAFYIEQAGFGLDVDHSAGEDFRIVQLTPPGSACSITLMRNTGAAGSLSANSSIVIFTAATITNVTATNANGTYAAGTALALTSALNVRGHKNTRWGAVARLLP